MVKKIREKIEGIKDYKFGCNVVVFDQTLKSLRENVFKLLSETDYFVFIDFKRERLVGDSVFEQIVPPFFSRKKSYRGSLFTNQELGIASFVDLHHEVLLLQEKGVKPLDGMLNAMQGNIIPFDNRNKLPEKIANLIETKCRNGEWTDKTRNTLNLSVYPDSAHRLDQTKTDGRFSRPFHIRVENLHHRKDARSCFAYLDEVVDLNSNHNISKNEKWETAEFKWAGTRLASVRIAPKPSYRIFDAAWLFENRERKIEMGFFNSIVPSPTDYFPHQLRPGRYRLTFIVVSDNFVPVRKSFIFEFGQTLESGKLSEEI